MQFTLLWNILLILCLYAGTARAEGIICAESVLGPDDMREHVLSLASAMIPGDADPNTLLVEQIPASLLVGRGAERGFLISVGTGFDGPRTILKAQEQKGNWSFQMGRGDDAENEFRRIENLNSAILASQSEDFLLRDLRNISNYNIPMAEWNADVLYKLRTEPLPQNTRSRIVTASLLDARQIFNRVQDNPIATHGRIQHYSTKCSGAGFCWGRAMAAHIEALRYGISKDSIRKVWLVGPLESEGRHWTYHVTTIIRGLNGIWYAIDTNSDRPLPLEDWFMEQKRIDDPKGLARLIVTSAQRFAVNDPSAYPRSLSNPQGGSNPYFMGYFSDLLGFFRADAHALALFKNMTRSKPN